MLSEMRHDRIANLRGVIIQPQLRAMIFEYTDLGDLKTFLQARNPNSDIPAVAPPLSLDQQIDICHQVNFRLRKNRKLFPSLTILNAFI